MDIKQKERIIKSILDNPMDRDTWIDAGKSCGWGNKRVLGSHGMLDRDTHLHYAKFFHEINLTEGWEKAVEYLSSLIK